MSKRKPKKPIINIVGAYARPLYWDYPTNKALIYICILFGFGATVVFYLIHVDLVFSLIQGMLYGLTIFLTWAITREIDPDHEYSAFVGIFIATYFWWAVDDGVRLWVVFFGLIFIRVLNRISGPRPKLVDAVLPFGLAVYVTINYGWFYGILAAIIYFMDTKLSRPYVIHQWTGLFMLGVSIGMYFVFSSYPTFASRSAEMMVLIGVISGFYLWHVYETRELETKTDVGSHQLDVFRVRLAQGFVWVMCLGAWVIYGDVMIEWLMPFWAAMFAIPLYKWGEKLFIKIIS